MRRSFQKYFPNLWIFTLLFGAFSLHAQSPSPRRVMVVRVNFTNASVPCDRAWVARVMWNDNLNVNGLFETASFGTISFTYDANNDGQDDVFDVAIAEAASATCSWPLLRHWQDLALQDLNGRGVNTNLYQHKIFLLPNEIPCGPGHGDLNCGDNCTLFLRYCSWPDLYAHELGHNLGMDHARVDSNNDGTADSEYGDSSDIMGNSMIGYRHFNAMHKRLMNWIGADGEAGVEATASYDILATESNPASADSARGKTQILKIAIPETPDNFYYVSFRSKLDAYSEKLTDPGKVHIHRGILGTRYSNFVKAIGPGQRFYDERGVRVEVHEIDAHYASLTAFLGEDAVPPEPTPSPGPTPEPSPEEPQMISALFHVTGTARSPRSFGIKLKALGTRRSITLRFNRRYQANKSLLTGSYQLSIIGKGLRLLTRAITLSAADSHEVLIRVSDAKRAN